MTEADRSYPNSRDSRAIFSFGGRDTGRFRLHGDLIEGIKMLQRLRLSQNVTSQT